MKLGVHGERWGEDVAIKLIKRGNVDTAQRGEKVRREIEVLKVSPFPFVFVKSVEKLIKFTFPPRRWCDTRILFDCTTS